MAESNDSEDKQQAPSPTGEGRDSTPLRGMGAGGLVEAASVTPADVAEPSNATSAPLNASAGAKDKAKLGPVILLALIALAVLAGIIWSAG